MLGLIKYLKKNTRSKVIFEDFKNPNLDDLSLRLRRAIRKVAQQNKLKVDKSVKNIIAAQDFFLSTIFVMQPIDKDVLYKVVNKIPGFSFNKKDITVLSSLSILIKKGDIILENGKYKLTNKGLESFNKRLSVLNIKAGLKVLR